MELFYLAPQKMPDELSVCIIQVACMNVSDPIMSPFALLTDMFNGYVWQTRTLEVRPDRLPNDFDSSGILAGGGSMNKIPSGLSPQLMQYGPAALGGVPSAVHPLSMSTSSAGSASLQSTSLNSSLSSSSMGTSVTAHSSLAMPTGMSGASQDHAVFSPDTAHSTSFLGDMSRSPSAFKMSSMNGSSKPQKQFDALGLSSGGAGGALGGATSLGNNTSGFSPNKSSNSSADLAGRTIYVSNVCVYSF